MSRHDYRPKCFVAFCWSRSIDARPVAGRTELLCDTHAHLYDQLKRAEFERRFCGWKRTDSARYNVMSAWVQRPAHEKTEQEVDA